MNIKDFPSHYTKEHLPNMWDYIFQRQKELAKKYNVIEGEQGLRWVIESPVDLDDPKGQLQLKDYAWRVVEEVGESLESYFITMDELVHAQEELADGLHFMVELVLAAGLDASDIKNIFSLEHFSDSRKYEEFKSYAANFIMHLGASINCLKLKPWKQTHEKTDKAVFHQRLKIAFLHYIALMLCLMEPVEVLNLYFSKSEVNKFRIRSNY
jgi:hypothetical protein